MKKLLLLLTTLLLMTAVSSCTPSAPSVEGTRMDSADATTRVIDALKKHIRTGWKITAVTWNDSDSLANTLHTLDVEIITKINKRYLYQFNVDSDSTSMIGKRRRIPQLTLTPPKFDSIRGITPNSIDVEVVQQQFAEAKKMIPSGYKFHSIASYSIREILPIGSKYLNLSNNEYGTTHSEFVLRLTESNKELPEREVTVLVLSDGSVHFAE